MQRDDIPFSPWERTVLSGTDCLVSTDSSGVLKMKPLSEISSAQTYKIGISMDGGGSVIPTGSFGDTLVPFNCSIQKYIFLADQTGSISVDIWKSDYDSYPPTSSLLSITANNSASISSGNIKNMDSTLSGWSKNLLDGDILRFVVNSCENITKCNLTLIVET